MDYDYDTETLGHHAIASAVVGVLFGVAMWAIEGFDASLREFAILSVSFGVFMFLFTGNLLRRVRRRRRTQRSRPLG